MQAFFRLSVPSCRLALRARFAALVCLAALVAGQAHAWSLDDVAGLAQQSAQAPFQSARHAVPAELAKLDYDGYRDIRFNPDRALWRADQLPYEANFFHVGPHGDSVRIHEITPEGVKLLPYDPANFNFGKNKVTPQRWGDLGHGGLRAFSHLNSAAYKDELIVFLGASYF
ncbi:MAG TPA: glucan biosynthesis protein D, partial [Polaromonas sp.]|nr:glucan biosynthesis protein D [Polaromonas sp.]